MYAAALIPETTGAHALLAKIKGHKLCDGDGVLWDTFTPGWWLSKLGRIEFGGQRAQGGGTAGRLRLAGTRDRPHGIGRRQASERYLIHPALLAGAKHEHLALHA